MIVLIATFLGMVPGKGTGIVMLLPALATASVSAWLLWLKYKGHVMLSRDLARKMMTAAWILAAVCELARFVVHLHFRHVLLDHNSVAPDLQTWLALTTTMLVAPLAGSILMHMDWRIGAIAISAECVTMCACPDFPSQGIVAMCFAVLLVILMIFTIEDTRRRSFEVTTVNPPNQSRLSIVPSDVLIEFLRLH